MIAPRRVIDIHAHAFPDELAARAVPRLAAEGNVTPALDGTVGALLGSMDQAGIEASVVASIATRPEQFGAIMSWSRSIASPRLIPFPSVHPDDSLAVDRIRLIARAGFRGVKLHPYYQDFAMDEERMLPLYRAISDSSLVLLCHTGFDIAYERRRIADPARIARVLDAFPDLKLVAPHLGAWDDWDEVERLLVGRDLAMDVAYVFGYLPKERIRRILLRHPPDRIVFGTDSPWAGQREVLDEILALDLPGALAESLLWKNAARILGLEPRLYSSPLR